MSKQVKALCIATVILSFCMLTLGFATLQDTLTVEGNLSFKPEDAVLLPGWQFAGVLTDKAPNVTSVIFDTIEGFDFSNPEYNNVTLNGSSYVPVDENGKGLIRLYVVGDTAYVLSDRQIYGGWDCSAMFAWRSTLTSITFNSFDTSRTVHMGSMFSGCTGLTTLDLSGFDTSNVIDMHAMFINCSSLTQVNVSSFDTSSVTWSIDYPGMSAMFSGCHSLTQLDLSNFDTSNVEDMSLMFYECKSLTSLDLSSFDTRKVRNMHYMFGVCQSLTELNILSFDTRKVEDMSLMFRACSSIEVLDLSSFDTSKITNINWMFGRCSSLLTIYAHDWVLSDACKSQYIFYSNYTENEDHTTKTTLVGEKGTLYAYQHFTVYAGQHTFVDNPGIPGEKSEVSYACTANYARIDGGDANPGYFTKKP